MSKTIVLTQKLKLVFVDPSPCRGEDWAFTRRVWHPAVRHVNLFMDGLVDQTLLTMDAKGKMSLWPWALDLFPEGTIADALTARPKTISLCFLLDKVYDRQPKTVKSELVQFMEGQTQRFHKMGLVVDRANIYNDGILFELAPIY